MGSVVKFGFSGAQPPIGICANNSLAQEIPIVFVKMDSLKIKFSVSSTIDNIIPFVATTTITKLNNKWFRSQLPLCLAHACTVHKAQGCTAEHGVVVSPSQGHIFARGLEYVMMSRATKLEHVYLLSQLHEKHFNGFVHERKLIALEYDRLRQSFSP